MNWNKVIAVSFSCICLILSFGLLLPAKEDGNFVYGATGFLVVSLSLLWLFYAFFERKQVAHKTIWFLLVAIGICGLTIPVWWTTETISNAYYAGLEENFRNTTVTHFHDEILYTPKKNPLGIRLHYTVTIPRSGRYFPQPSVSNGKSRVGHFHLEAVQISPMPELEGRGVSLTGQYQAGVSYEIVADLWPQFILPEQKKRSPCVFFTSLDEENSVRHATAPERLEVDIEGTSFSRYYGQGIHYLENEYSLKAFYDTLAREEIPRCVGY